MGAAATPLFDKPAPRITADDVRRGLMKAFSSEATNGRYALLFEVSNSTGHSRSRSADAIIMSCWPSDVLELHGVDAEVERRVENRLKARTPDKLTALLETVAAFEVATGISLHREESYGYLATHDGKEIGRMVAAIRASNLGRSWQGLPALMSSLDQAKAAVAEAADALGIHIEPTKPKRRVA
jgi:hypothetical protein